MPATFPPNDTTMKYIAPRPPVGMFVAWYKYGDRKQTYFPAMVTATTDRNVISLMLFTPSGHMKTIIGTWHVDDPAIKGKEHQVRSERGGWDYLPGTVPIDMNRPQVGTPSVVIESLQREVAGLKEQVATLMRGPTGSQSDPADMIDVDDQIRNLFSNGLPPGDIAERCGVSIQKVNAVLRRPKQERPE